MTRCWLVSGARTRVINWRHVGPGHVCRQRNDTVPLGTRRKNYCQLISQDDNCSLNSINIGAKVNIKSVLCQQDVVISIYDYIYLWQQLVDIFVELQQYRNIFLYQLFNTIANNDQIFQCKPTIMLLQRMHGIQLQLTNSCYLNRIKMYQMIQIHLPSLCQQQQM